MASTPFAPAQPAGISVSGGLNSTFLSTLGINDRSFLPTLLEVFGKESYLYFLEQFGAKTKTENESYYHYENSSKLHSSVKVASHTGGASNGVVAVITLDASSHYNSGTQSPIRVGETVEIQASGIFGQITAVDKSTPSAHTATIYPLRSTEAFAPANNDYLLFHGLTDVGEKSDQFDSIQNPTRKITNTVTQIREDFEITDKAMMERVEWSYNGSNYYKNKGTGDAEKRFLNNVEGKLTFGVDVTNTQFTAKGTKGTKGIIPLIKAGGGTLQYTQGSLAITDYQGINRQLDFNGAGAEIHSLVDTYQYQEIMNKLFALYPNGAVLWDSVGGSAEAAAKYGFGSLTIENYNYHWKKYAPFSPEWKYGTTAAGAYKNYGLVIPQGQTADAQGNVGNSIEVMYMDIPGFGEVYAAETGGLAKTPTSTKMNLVNTFMVHKGIRLRAANQCVIFQGV